MANSIQIKRRNVAGGAGAPATLLSGELAYNEAGNILYYGFGDTPGVVSIGGSGAFADLSTNQTINGNKTFGNTINGSISGNAATATVLQNARNFSIAGDVTAPAQSFNGSANIILTASLATVAGLPTTTVTKFTVNTKGIVQTAAQASLSDLTAPTANFDFANRVLTSLGTPSAATDACTKGYADSVSIGTNYLASARLASTANITTLAGALIIDGVQTVVTDRVLVKDQSDQTTNGVYRVQNGAWTRATDAATGTQLYRSAILVTAGNTQAATGWACTITSTAATSFTFVQTSASASYTAGSGLSLTGNAFAAKIDNRSLAIVNTNLAISDTWDGGNSTSSGTISKLSTVTLGTWNASVVAVTYGGTGSNSLSGVLKGNGTAAVSTAANVPGTGTGQPTGDYLDPNSRIYGGSF